MAFPISVNYNWNILNEIFQRFKFLKYHVLPFAGFSLNSIPEIRFDWMIGA
jgi:hypothetical protein